MAEVARLDAVEADSAAAHRMAHALDAVVGGDDSG